MVVTHGEERMAARIQKRQVRTRARLIRSAYEIMSAKGVDGTAIQEVTEAADIGFGTFYNYFASKDELAENVLDCVIHNLGQRNRLANQRAGVTDPLAIISNSVRLTAREMRSNPMWRWWLKRTDLMVRRMRLGFKPFGLADMALAVESGTLSLPHDDAETAWSYLIWLLAGTITDLVEEELPASQETRMAEAILRVMGVPNDRAETVAALPLPRLPPLDIDFNFRLVPAQEVA